MDNHFRLRMAAGMLLVMGVMAAGMAASAVGLTSNGVAVSHFATGFPTAKSGTGPTGVAFDLSQHMYVSDAGFIYRFDQNGGRADLHRLNRTPIRGILAGLAFSRSGQLYAARWTNGTVGDVIQIDPNTGALMRQVASGLVCPTGLAVDPISGDLFVSEVWCAPRVLRISGGRVSTYVTGANTDGLAFGPDGTLYMAHQANAAGFTVSAASATNSAHPGTVTNLAKVPNADGIAVGRAFGSDTTPFLVVNRRDGMLSRVEIAGGSAIARLFGGGTRGDFVGVDGAGCLYATQSSELLRVTNLDGSCARAASAPPSAVATGLGAGLVPTNVRAMSVTVAAPRRPTACAAGRRLIARYRARRGVHVVSARIYIGRHLARRVSGRALRHGVTLRKLPTGRFTLVIRARTTRHRTIVVRRHYGTCAGRRA